MIAEVLDPEITRAFQCTGPNIPLAGGEGRSVRVGNCVLKPIDDPVRYSWACDLMARMIPTDGFRIAQPRKARNGSFVYRDWGAAAYEPGEHLAGRWREKLQVTRRFHTKLNELAPLAMPPGNDHWSRAHEIAWQLAPLPPSLSPQILEKISKVFSAYRDLPRSTDLIHADICGNILFHNKLAPAIIDFSPAYGSVEYAESILIADAIAWEHAPVTIMGMVPSTDHFRQTLLRAISFRVLVPALRKPEDSRPFLQEYGAYEPVLKLIAG